MADAEAMMSSSKIIKQSDGEKTFIADFSFSEIYHSNSATFGGQSSGTFVPMASFQGYESSCIPEDKGEAVGPPLVEISEDDLSQRIKEAYNSGLKDGKELAERGLLNVFKALRASSEAIHDLRDKVFREAEDELINLIMLVARKVINREVSQDRTILVGVVKNAIADLSVREQITVRIHPDDYILATSGSGRSMLNDLLNDRFALKADQSVASGFCLVDTDMGTIDASLEGQLDEIYRTLLESRITAEAVEQ